VKNQDEDKWDETVPIFIEWYDFLKWLFITTDKFPKKSRFTFTDRINNAALDVLEDLVEARYSRDKLRILRAANLRLERIRILLRVCFEMKFLSQKSFEHSIRSINVTGRMLGGWIKQQQERKQ
jgi:four helix bundle protein